MMSLKRPNGWVYQLGEYHERKLWAEEIYAGGSAFHRNTTLIKPLTLGSLYDRL